MNAITNNFRQRKLEPKISWTVNCAKSRLMNIQMGCDQPWKTGKLVQWQALEYSFGILFSVKSQNTVWYFILDCRRWANIFSVGSINDFLLILEAMSRNVQKDFSEWKGWVKAMKMKDMYRIKISSKDPCVFLAVSTPILPA